MYGKVFESIYDGTLYGHWEAIVTMQQLVVLASADGVVDMTPQAIAARTSIPLEIITKGLKTLSEPDPYTRTPGEEGRRIVLLDAHRPWGWRLVNHGKYKRLRNMAEKREADRQRQSEKRSKSKDVAIVSQNVAKVAHTDADTNTEKQKQRAFARPAWVPDDAWQDFEEHRKKKRCPMTDKARQLIVAKMEKLDPTHAHARALLEQSIRKGWLDVFPLRDEELAQQQRVQVDV